MMSSEEATSLKSGYGLVYRNTAMANSLALVYAQEGQVERAIQALMDSVKILKAQVSDPRSSKAALLEWSQRPSKKATSAGSKEARLPPLIQLANDNVSLPSYVTNLIEESNLPFIVIDQACLVRYPLLEDLAAIQMYNVAVLAVHSIASAIRSGNQIEPHDHSMIHRCSQLVTRALYISEQIHGDLSCAADLVLDEYAFSARFLFLRAHGTLLSIMGQREQEDALQLLLNEYAEAALHFDPILGNNAAGAA